MTKKKITSVDDLEVGKYYRQGKGYYFRFIGKDEFDDSVGSLVLFDKCSVKILYNQSIPWLFDVNEDVKEVSDEEFVKALSTAMKRVSKICKKFTNDMILDILKKSNCS